MEQIVTQIKEEEAKHDPDCPYLKYLPCTCHVFIKGSLTTNSQQSLIKIIYRRINTLFKCEMVDVYTILNPIIERHKNVRALVLTLIYLNKIKADINPENFHDLVLGAFIAAIIYVNDYISGSEIVEVVEGSCISIKNKELDRRENNYPMDKTLAEKEFIFLQLIDYRLYVPEWEFFELFNELKEGL